MADPASAARRLADLARSHGTRDGYPHMCDLVALLPILDAVTAGPGNDRLERWSRAMCVAAGVDPDRDARQGSGHFDGHQPEWHFYRGEARAAIALFDAERVAAAAEGWAAYEEALCGFQRAANALWTSNRKTESSARDALCTARTALDAAVRRLAGLPAP